MIRSLMTMETARIVDVRDKWHLSCKSAPPSHSKAYPLLVSARGGILMSSCQRLWSSNQTIHPLPVVHDSPPPGSGVETPSSAPQQRTLLWSDRMAFRVWLVCASLLWFLGFINLVTGVARR